MTLIREPALFISLRDMYRCNDFDGLTGWRKVAVLNTTLLASVTLLFTTVLITSVLRSGEFIRTIVIYNGGCNGGSTSRVSITLHLVINVFSTAVLGSSNYFIQVLNAPTRDEIDANHKRGSYLEIGVSSWRNALRLSWFKTTACAFLCLSSIPIHFVFNSTIFEIDHRAANYDLTIASEGFVEGAPYFLPGASLAYGKAKGPLWDPARPDEPSDLLRRVSRASDDGARWAKLENDECMEYYVKGHGIQKYESVIVVVRGPFEGWRADQTWNLTTEVTKQWEKSMPSSQPNSLWFSAHCNMTMNRLREGFVVYNSCYRALGMDSAPDGYPSDRTNEWLIALLDNEPNHGIGDPDPYHTSVYPWPFDEHTYAWPCNLSQARGINIQLGRDHLDVEYCLAERKEVKCAVGFSNLLFLIVTLCVLTKTVVCIAVTVALKNEHSLVTIGDAVESFIAYPDQYSREFILLPHEAIVFENSGMPPDPAKWSSVQARGSTAIHWRNCSFNYFALAVIFTTGACSLLVLGMWHGITAFRGFDNSNADPDPQVTQPASFFLFIILANTPQFLLSLWYIAYNSLWTRWHMAKEWDSFSLAHQPLRVTFPRGRQISTYWLQLPFKYGVPIMLVSIGLHWFMSNAFYVFVGQGDYYHGSSGVEYLSSLSGYGPVGFLDPHLPDDCVMGMRFSTSALGFVLIICLLLIIALAVTASRKFKGYMPLVGSNSAAISSACYVSTLSKVTSELYTPEKLAKDKATNLDSGIAHGRSNEERLEDDNLRRLPQCLLMWGIVQMPPEWYATEAPNEGEYTVAYLGFGTKLDDVQAPTEGSEYLFR